MCSLLTTTRSLALLNPEQESEEGANYKLKMEDGSAAQEKHTEGASCLNVLLGQIHFSRQEEKGGSSVESELGVCLELSLQIQQLAVTNRTEAQPHRSPQRASELCLHNKAPSP